jgi:hypothetical protein
MARMQKLTWEHVSAIAHPDCYAGDGPAVRREDVLESYWSPVETDPRGSVAEQYNGIVLLIERGELIRNLRRYEAEIPDVEWVDTTPRR